MAPLYREVVPVAHDVSSADGLLQAANAFRRDGYVMMQVMDKTTAENMIIEQWDNLIGAQPYK
eukprot:2285643-Rhodomonas_salina.1